MAQFRKKPVVIEAYQFHNRVCTPEDRPQWLIDAYDRGEVKFSQPREAPAFLMIPTLEGEMRAEIDDWIIRGIKGELYPCKPDIFAATYEPASDSDRNPEGEDRDGLRAEHESAGAQPIAQTAASPTPDSHSQDYP